MGMYMAITCAEDLPFIDVDAERRAAEGTFLGSYRVDQQAAACRAWPHAQPNAVVHTPVVSGVPTLLLVGEFDPATPPRVAPGIVASLAHGRTIVVPNRGHEMSEEWDACLGKISTSFLETADETHLDAACVGRLHMPSFVTTPVPAN
jgi:pimeloyl-ACP methyl ester carboxylesterase